MPELPEVESLRGSLEKAVLGQTILKITVLNCKLVSGKGTKRDSCEVKVSEFVKGLTGERIAGVERVAKNLIFKFEGNDKSLVVHLKMTGQLVFQSESGVKTFGGHPIRVLELPSKHSYVTFELSEGDLFYNDVRMFGYLLYYENEKEMLKEHDFGGLGVDPLGREFDLEDFARRLSTVRGSVKAMFLKQQVVVGLGNIYADEVCFEARVRPDRAVSSLTEAEIERLFVAIRRILKLAIEMGGSSVANYLLADGSKGNYAKLHKVYLKGGQPCQICGSILEKIKLVNRSTVFCNHCQK